MLCGIWREELAPVAPISSEPLLQVLEEEFALGLVAPRLIGQVGTLPVRAQEAYWGQALQAALQARLVREVVQGFLRVGINPILLKGLAVARHYARPAARHIGDIDLLIDPRDFARGFLVLQNAGFREIERFIWGEGAVIHLQRADGTVDLQTHLWPLDREETRTALAAPHWAEVDGMPVPVLPTNTEIRFLCTHAVRHAFTRPVWLCDVGAAVESADAVDWDRVLTGSRRVRNWVMAALGLGADLLDLTLPTGIAPYCAPQAAWLAPQVLRRWGGWSEPNKKALLHDVVHGRSTIIPAVRAARRSLPDSLQALSALGWPLSRPLAGPAMAALLTVRAVPRRQPFRL